MGSSCFNEPALQDILFSEPPCSNDAKSADCVGSGTASNTCNEASNNQTETRGSGMLINNLLPFFSWTLALKFLKELSFDYIFRALWALFCSFNFFLFFTLPFFFRPQVLSRVLISDTISKVIILTEVRQMLSKLVFAHLNMLFQSTEFCWTRWRRKCWSMMLSAVLLLG